MIWLLLDFASLTHIIGIKLYFEERLPAPRFIDHRALQANSRIKHSSAYIWVSCKSLLTRLGYNDDDHSWLIQACVSCRSSDTGNEAQDISEELTVLKHAIESVEANLDTNVATSPSGLAPSLGDPVPWTSASLSLSYILLVYNFRATSQAMP